MASAAAARDLLFSVTYREGSFESNRRVRFEHALKRLATGYDEMALAVAYVAFYSLTYEVPPLQKLANEIFTGIDFEGLNPEVRRSKGCANALKDCEEVRGHVHFELSRFGYVYNNLIDAGYFAALERNSIDKQPNELDLDIISRIIAMTITSTICGFQNMRDIESAYLGGGDEGSQHLANLFNGLNLTSREYMAVKILFASSLQKPNGEVLEETRCQDDHNGSLASHDANFVVYCHYCYAAEYVCHLTLKKLVDAGTASPISFSKSCHDFVFDYRLCDVEYIDSREAYIFDPFTRLLKQTWF